MSGKTVATTGALHGVTTWALTTLLVLYLVSTSIGSVVGGTFRGISTAVGGIGQAASEMAGPMLQDANLLEALERGVRATDTDPEALDARAVNAMRCVVASDESGAAAGGAGAVRGRGDSPAGGGTAGGAARAAVSADGRSGAAEGD
ncbi:hypothetical protein [Rhodobacter sp. NSM]|uniref:hypothetical protein n=1 Tax=Rhodobacter sp. NSM TaxID=3457501 RepID=UPI003FD58B77